MATGLLFAAQVTTLQGPASVAYAIIREHNSVPNPRLLDSRDDFFLFVSIAVTCPGPISHVVDLTTPQVWL
jgi:hypothetical protein